MTSIKVPAGLGDRIRLSAQARGVSVAVLVSELLDRHERAERFLSVKAAYARLPSDDDYWAETRVWEALEVSAADTGTVA